MIRVAYCDNNLFTHSYDVSVIKNYLSECEVVCFDTITKLLKDVRKTGQYDAYFLAIDNIDIGDVTAFGLQLYRKGKGKVIYLTNTTDCLAELFSSHPYDCIIRPNYKEKLLSLKRDLYSTISIRGVGGIVRAKAEEILYANKQGRIAQYHLSNSNIVDTHCLRGSFADSVKDILINNDCFILLGTSYLINKNHITTFNTEYIQLDNNEILYLPKNSMKVLENTLEWLRGN